MARFNPAYAIIIVFIIFFFIIILDQMVKKANPPIHDKEIGIIKIYHRGLDFIGHDDVPEGPRVHPFIKDWDGVFHELDNQKGKIIILNGNASDMSKETQYYLKRNPRPEQTIEVNKKKFLQAIEEFSKKHNGTPYHILDFSDNCIGFKNFVVDKSKV